MSRLTRSIVPAQEDWLGRRSPRPVGMATFFRAIPGLAAQFRDVPADYVAYERPSDDEATATVRCVCGEHPKLELGESCQCACGRFFVNLDPHVMVANTPAPAP